MAILFDKVMIARKRHRCDQCCAHISPGERYYKQVHTEDGFQVYKAHEDCDACARELRGLSHFYPEEFIILSADVTREDKGWIKKRYPTVYKRLFVKL